jgi:hypothetical protein
MTEVSLKEVAFSLELPDLPGFPTLGDATEVELWEMSEALGAFVDKANALRDEIDRHLLRSGYRPPGED